MNRRIDFSKYTIRPGGYESDDDFSDEYDDFGYKVTRQTPRVNRTEQDVWIEDAIRAASKGEVATMRELLDKCGDIVNIDTPLSGSLNLLMHACLESHPDVVKLLIDRGANVNTDSDSITPLMYACQATERSPRVIQVVDHLLAAGAEINITSLYGDTPMIFAAQNGHTEVVARIVGEASLDATNNVTGNSAIFYAIEKNHHEIVKILLENGASIDVANRKGYLPRAVAEIHGFHDIMELFPKVEERYRVPPHYCNITHYRDMVPGILGPTDVPPYFYRIGPMLTGMEAGLLHEHFAKNRVGLPQFLAMTPSQLKECDVQLPWMQKRVMRGLFHFHKRPWSRSSIPVVAAGARFDTFELYTMLANDLQQFVVMQSGLVFLLNFDHDQGWSYPAQKNVIEVVKLLESWREHLRVLKEYVQAIQARNPKHRVDEITDERVRELNDQKKLFRTKTVIKYSFALGLVCLVGVIFNRHRYFK